MVSTRSRVLHRAGGCMPSPGHALPSFLGLQKATGTGVSEDEGNLPGLLRQSA